MGLGSYLAGKSRQVKITCKSETELIEELGFTAVLGQYYGQADEYFYSSHRDTYYYNPAYIYEVVDYTEAQKPLEDFNNLAWFPVDEAIEKLKRAVTNGALNSGKIPTKNKGILSQKNKKSAIINEDRG